MHHCTHFLHYLFQILDAPLHTHFLHYLFTNSGCTTVHSLPSLYLQILDAPLYSLPSLLVYKSWMHHCTLTSFTTCLQILVAPLHTHFLHYLFTNPCCTTAHSLPSALTSLTTCLQLFILLLLFLISTMIVYDKSYSYAVRQHVPRLLVSLVHTHTLDKNNSQATQTHQQNKYNQRWQ